MCGTLITYTPYDIIRTDDYEGDKNFYYIDCQNCHEFDIKHNRIIPYIYWTKVRLFKQEEIENYYYAENNFMLNKL